MKIKGFVDDDLIPRIPFQSLGGQKLFLVVDTGFNGSLCLPKSLIRELGFEFIGTFEIELADGSRVSTKVYAGEILWFRKKKEVSAYETLSKEGLVGTQLLRGALFELDVNANHVMISEK